MRRSRDRLAPSALGSCGRSVVSVDRVAEAFSSIGGPPRVHLWERPAPGAERQLSAELSLPEWSDLWSIYGLATADDLVAHQLWRNFQARADLIIHEKVGADWETTTLPLPPEDPFIRFGQITAVAGDQVLTLTARTINLPVKVRVVQRTANGWEDVQLLRLPDLRATWFENPSKIVQADGVAVVTASFSPSAAVAICERDTAGVWAQTALLSQPAPNAWSTDVAVAPSGDRVALAWQSRSSTGQEQVVVEIHERAAGGSGSPWTLAQSLTVPLPSSLWSAIAFDGDRLAVSNFDTVYTFERSSSGDLVQGADIAGILRPSGFSGNELIGITQRATAAVDVPSGSATVQLCSLAGLVTCPPGGAATLRVHDTHSVAGRRAAAEIVAADPGATVLLFRSAE
ncbi:MAG: hypothetical protein AAGG01_22370, partial [Planctomycetota bacterium]